MLDTIKNLFGRRRPTATSVAEEELYVSQLKLLEAQTALEWARSNVEYQQSRITRLRQFIWDQERELEPKSSVAPKLVA
jgi:hypothetical protein